MRDNKYYREAVAMARTRLHENDPLLIETVRIWALRLKTGKNKIDSVKILNCFETILGRDKI